MNEVVQLVDRWLKHPLYGVESALATVPRHDPDGGADFPLPEMPKIYNDVECKEIMEGGAPPSRRSLIVFLQKDDGSIVLNPARQISRKMVVSVAMATEGEDFLVSRREAGYLFRALRKSMTAYNSQAYSAGYRELNAIKIASVDGVASARSGMTVGRSRVWGFASITLTVIDLDP